MRVALLSLTDHVPGPSGGSVPRGLLPFGPRTVADAQLEFVLGLGCERIVCLAQGVQPGIIDLQRRAEGAGAQFHLIRSSRNLASLVKSADELIVLTDGLLPLADQARDLLSEGFAVLALPVEQGLASGFERIDLNHAWAGAMKLPGALVERLFELPEDVDAPAALLRIALQSGVSERLLSESLLADGCWSLVRSAADASSREDAWIRRQALGADPFSPSAWIGGRLAAGLGARLMQRGLGSATLAAASLLLVLAALALASRFSAATGLVIFAIALAMLETALALQRLEGPSPRRRMPRLAAMRRLYDVPFAMLLALAIEPQVDWQAQFFAPLVVLGLSWLLPALHPGAWTRLVADRSLLAIVSAVLAAIAGLLLPVLRVYALALVALCLFVARVGQPITRP